jgi:hypothetical protein
MTDIRWTAGPDGIAHAHVAGRTACRAPAIGEQRAHPTIRKCPACLAAVATIEGKRG